MADASSLNQIITLARVLRADMRTTVENVLRERANRADMADGDFPPEVLSKFRADLRHSLNTYHKCLRDHRQRLYELLRLVSACLPIEALQMRELRRLDEPELWDWNIADEELRIIEVMALNRMEAQELPVDSMPTAGGDDADAADPIAECLDGQSLKLYYFLRERRHWTTYKTLADKEGFWRQADPSDQTVHRSLRRLQTSLNAIPRCAVNLQIEHENCRARLTGQCT